MPNVSDYLNQLINDKKNLVSNLVEKGITATNEETFTQLIPKVLDIETGIDTSDASAEASDIRLNKTAYVNGELLTGTIEDQLSETFIPTIEDQTLSSGKYLAEDIIIKGDSNLLAENIKFGVELFGVTGSYKGSESTGVSEGELLNTSSFTSKDETLSTYGSLVYVKESTSEDGFITLSSMVEKWGGTSNSNNYLGSSSEQYGISMANWSENEGSTELFINQPMNLINGTLLLTFNSYVSSWMNPVININLIKPEGNTEDELLESIKTKIENSEFAYSKSYTYNGSLSLQNVIVDFGAAITEGTYYLHLSGHTKADNSNFTYVKISYVNY